MKKIIIRVLVCLVVFTVVVAGMLWYMLFKEPDDAGDDVNQNTVVDVYGSTYLAAVDEQGTTYAIVTDASGNRYAASYNGSQVGETIVQVNDQIPIESVPTNYTGPTVDMTTTASTTQQGQTTSQYIDTTTQPTQTTQSLQPSQTTSQYVEPTSQQVPSTAPSSQPNTETTTAAPNPYELRAYRIEMYQQIFQGGTYLMEFTSNDADLGDTPITMAIKNGNMYIETSIEGMACTMLFRKDKDTMYLFLDEWKKYCKLPEDLMGEDFDMSSMTTNFTVSDIGEVSVSQVEINGKQLILESYVSLTDGATVNYYFDGENLVRRDSISKTGEIDTINFSVFTTNVPDSYFEIPSDYGYLNLDWLSAFM